MTNAYPILAEAIARNAEVNIVATLVNARPPIPTATADTLTPADIRRSLRWPAHPDIRIRERATVAHVNGNYAILRLADGKYRTVRLSTILSATIA
jgi:hypothetical protein